jgi:hypothetical protein
MPIAFPRSLPERLKPVAAVDVTSISPCRFSFNNGYSVSRKYPSIASQTPPTAAAPRPAPAARASHAPSHTSASLAPQAPPPVPHLQPHGRHLPRRCSSVVASLHTCSRRPPSLSPAAFSRGSPPRHLWRPSPPPACRACPPPRGPRCAAPALTPGRFRGGCLLTCRACAYPERGVSRVCVYLP